MRFEVVMDNGERFLAETDVGGLVNAVRLSRPDLTEPSSILTPKDCRRLAAGLVMFADLIERESRE